MGYVSGLIYEYYHLCPRKAWYCAHGLSMEGENENVQIGKLIDETAYSRERKHILVDDRASIDFLRDNTIYEVKKSTREKASAIAQIQYYLYVLHEKGLTEATGELRVPRENFIERVKLSEEDRAQIMRTIAKIETLLQQELPPPGIERRGVCKKCAYFELCVI